jgi:hypothetical protein
MMIMQATCISLHERMRDNGVGHGSTALRMAKRATRKK